MRESVRHIGLWTGGLVFSIAIAGCGSGGASGSASAPAPLAASAGPTTEASPGATAGASPATGPTTVGQGQFHPVDGTAPGTAYLIRHPKGSFYVDLEQFCGGSLELHILLVPTTDVTSDGDVDAATMLDLGALRSPCGGVNQFPLPPAADPTGYHTVVVWNPTTKQAIAAAPLR